VPIDNVPFLIFRKVCLFVSFVAVIRYRFVLHLARIRFFTVALHWTEKTSVFEESFLHVYRTL